MSWLPVSFGKLSDLSDIADSFNKLSESVKNIELNFDTALGFENANITDGQNKQGKKEETEATVAAALKGLSRLSGVVGLSASTSQAAPANEDAESKGAGRLSLGTRLASPSVAPSTPANEQVVEDGGEVRQSTGNFLAEQSASTAPQSEEREGVVDRVDREEDVRGQGTSDVLTGDGSLVLARGKVGEDADGRRPADGKGTTKEAQVSPSSTGRDVDVVHTHPSVADGGLSVVQGAEDSAEHSERGAGDRGREESSNPSARNEQGISESASEVVQAADKAEVEATSGVDAAASSSELQAVKQVDAAGSLPQTGSDQAHDDYGHRGTTGGEVIEPGGHELEDGGTTSNVDMKEESVSLSPPVVVEADKGQALPSLQENEELGTLKREMQMMQTAVQGAARQAQAKADELSRIMFLNDQLRAEIAELKKKASNDAEIEMLKEEFQVRLGAAERKVYALTKERDMLKREQSKNLDTSTLLKEKDEIIKQVMAEGEELSKKQAAQELIIKKLRAQVRELEEERQKLTSKLQVEEARVESLKVDKDKTEHELKEAVERSTAELAAHKELHVNAIAELKASLEKLEAKADNEAKINLEKQLKECLDREQSLIRTVEELRDALTYSDQQAAAREDMLRRDIEDLDRRCQAAEQKHEELVSQMPDSTRPLLRQIEALQESLAVRADAWKRVEQALNSRVRAAEAAVASAQDKEQMMSERLTQTTSRLAVMEAQLSCLRAEHAQLSRALEKERQRAQENRQEYLAASEAAATHEGRAKQLEEEIRELRIRHRKELAEERSRREVMKKEMEREKAIIMENEKRIQAEGRAAAEKAVASAQQAMAKEQQQQEKNRLRRMSSSSSAGSIEESSILQASLQGSPLHMSSAASNSNGPVPLVLGGRLSKGPSTLEQMDLLLRQKEGEISSYASRLAALESTRDSLAEELVRCTTQCESYKNEASSLPGLRAELEALRKRHTSALELMGERDEQVEELRADLADIKQMYREQIDMLVNQIEKMSEQLDTYQHVRH